MLVAMDIYRPAAIDQLLTLGKQAELPVFSLGTESPVKIANAAIKDARKQGCDTLILQSLSEPPAQRHVVQRPIRMARVPGSSYCVKENVPHGRV